MIALALVLLAGAGCAGDPGARAGADAPVPTEGPSRGSALPPRVAAGTAPGGTETAADRTAAEATTTAPVPPTTVEVPALTTASTILAPPCATSWPQIDAAVEPVPDSLRSALDRAQADAGFGDVTLGASVWIEGYGEVVAARPDEPLIPASGQKLVTAVGALGVLSPYAVPLPEAAPGQATWQLVHGMLGASANDHTDALLGVVGRTSGGAPSVAGGLAAAHATAERLCAPLDGTSVDGSGLSTGNRHSARSMRRLLQAVLPSPLGYTISAGLAVGGGSGTLLPRFVGTPAEGNVRAKTGSLSGVVSLTGHLRTAGGRLVVFSLIANGPGATADGQGPATRAIDALVVTLAADPS